MSGLVAFDSCHGNGEQVATAIAEELRAAGHAGTPADGALDDARAAARSFAETMFGG